MIALRKLAALLVVIVCTWLPAFTPAVAQTVNMKRAHDAFQLGKSYKAQGDLIRAERMFAIAKESAAPDSNIRYEVDEELSYYLPLMRIQRLVWDGRNEAAEQALLKLQQEFEGHPVRRQQIGEIVNGLRASAQAAQEETPDRISEQLLMRQVKALLHGFYVDHQRYPSSEADLTSVLPPNEPPLTGFDIKRYSSNASGYLLILQSKQNAEHLLTIQHTGLME